MTRLECFYDCTSPWTYLAFTGIQPIAERHGVDIEWRPILVGGVFNAVNQDLYAQREMAFGNERRMNYMMKDLKDWADLRGIEINWPSFHPVNAVKCMRGCFVAEEQGKLVAYSKALFEAYWGRCEDVASEAVLGAIVTGLGMEADAFLQLQTGVKFFHGLDDAQPRMDSTPGIIFMRLRPTKVDHEPIAKVFGNVAIVTLNHVGTGGLVSANDVA